MFQHQQLPKWRLAHMWEHLNTWKPQIACRRTAKYICECKISIRIHAICRTCVLGGTAGCYEIDSVRYYSGEAKRGKCRDLERCCVKLAAVFNARDEWRSGGKRT